MSSPQRRFLLLEQGVGSIVVNFPLNALIAFLMFRGMSEVPLWGDPSIGGDTIGTSFFLPFFTSLIGSRLIGRAVRAGHVAALGWTRATHPLLWLLPGPAVVRGTLLGIACAVTVGPLAVRVFAALGWGPLGLGTFVVLKAAYASVLGLFVTPVLALWTIAQAPRQ